MSFRLFQPVLTCFLPRPLFFGTALLLFGLPFSAVGQEFQPVKARGFCQFVPGEMPKEWLVFPDDSLRAIDIVEAILEKGGAGRRKFGLRCAMGEPAIALHDSSGQRVLVFSSSLFEKSSDSLLHLAALAHEIGHLAAGHRLNGPTPSEADELQADRFMGYVLCKFGFSLARIQGVIQQSGQEKSASFLARKAAVGDGFQKAQTSIDVADAAGFGEEIREKALKNFPKLDPVPAWSDSYMLKKPDNNWFQGCTTLAQIDTRICRALDDRAFTSRTYWQLEGGFALVTMMEQFEGANGQSWPNETGRWNSKPARKKNASLTEMLMGMAFPEPGRFRMFVFGVTSEVLKKDTIIPPDKPTAEKWLSQGLEGFLPEAVGSMAVLPETKVYALVFEYQKRTSDGQRKQLCIQCTESANWKRGAKQAYYHLEKSHLLDGLRR